MKLWVGALLCVFAFTSTACSNSFGVYVANPCSEAVEVSTYNAPDPNPDALGAVASVPAEGAEFLPHAFHPIPDIDWILHVETFNDDVQLDETALMGEEESERVIVIPSSMC